MTSIAQTAISKTKSFSLVSLLLFSGFLLALLLRVKIGSPDIAQSPTAGIIFAVCLLAISLCYGIKVKFSLKNIIFGIAGGLFLCLPAFYIAGGSLSAHYGNYLTWGLAITFVACCEEMFLRGVMFDALQKQFSKYWTILFTAVLFALLHLPLYGWHSVPLDFAVGLFLGNLRLLTKDFAAPAIAHSLADLIAWWI